MTDSNASPLVLVGWDFHATPVELRERLAFSAEAAREALAALRRNGLASEGVIVSTCNRSEIYAIAADAGADTTEGLTRFVAEFHSIEAEAIVPKRYGGRGSDAARHLLRVAAGLESLALGEDQILAQVRESLRVASGAGATRAVLHRLFQKAIETGKRVRTETRLASRPTSIPGVAMELAEKIFEDITKRSFLIVGAGEIATIFYDLLIARGANRIEVVNRSFERAEQLTRRGGVARRWDELASRIPHADVVVCATSSPMIVVSENDVRGALAHRRGQPVFVLDLAIPRNVDPAVANLENAYLSSVDDLKEIAEKNKASRAGDIPAAEKIVEDELADFLSWFGALAVVPTVTALREKFEAVRLQHFDRELERFAHLPEGDREKIRLLAQSMVKTLLREPTAMLKDEPDAARRLERAEAVRHLFGLSENDKKA